MPYRWTSRRRGKRTYKRGVKRRRKTWSGRRRLKTTLRGGRRGRHYTRFRKFKKRFKRGRNSSFRAIAKRVRQLPIPQLDTIYDDMHVGFTNTQGVDSWEGLGAPDTTARSMIAGLTLSADSIMMKMQQINSGGVVPEGWIMGRSAAVISSWEQKMRWNNVSNQPMKMTLYTLVARQDIPANFWNMFLGSTSSLLDLLETWFDDQYGSSVTSNRTLGHISFKLTDLASFKRFFRIAKVRNYTIQPGQQLNLKKYRRTPEYINTSRYFQPGIGPAVAAKKGNREYLWRLHSTTIESKDAGTASRVTPAYNFQTSYHYRVRYLANDTYNFQPPLTPVTGLTLHTIYPGTSTTGDLAPAT